MVLTSQNEEQETNQGAIPHEQHHRREAREPQLPDPIYDRKEEHEYRARSGAVECSPLPSIVLSAEKIIDEHDRNGRAGNDHDAVAEEEEAEHVVYLVEPDAIHDEEQLHEYGTERESAHE